MAASEQPKTPWEQLRAPFKPGTVGKLPRKGKRPDGTEYTVHLDYIGHAAVTDRLLSVDPQWTYEPMAKDEHGQPILDSQQGLWINLTVCGVTRPGYGYAIDNPNARTLKPRGDLIKEAIGDALRNAAMRFGVALDLWSKDELESQVEHPELKNEKPSQREQIAPPSVQPLVAIPAAKATEAIRPSKLTAIRALMLDLGRVGEQATEYCLNVIGKDKPGTENDADILLTRLQEDAELAGKAGPLDDDPHRLDGAL